MQNVILSQIPIKDLKEIITEWGNQLIQETKKNNLENRNESDFITIQECAEMLKCSIPTVHDHIKKGLYTRYKIGRKTLIKRSEVIQAIQKISA